MGYGISRGIKKYIDSILDVIYGSQEGCILCSDYAEEFLCTSCKDKINSIFIEGSIKRNGCSIKYYSCAYYSSVIKEMIVKLKYKSDFNSGIVLAQIMERFIRLYSLDADYIAYVPSDINTFRKRGFNQSEFLAAKVAQLTNKKLIRCIVKNKVTKDQIGLDGDLRWENLQGCFNVEENKNIRDRKVMLIDDVITTGATAFHCGGALLKAGCSEVTVLTVAKSTI